MFGLVKKSELDKAVQEKEKAISDLLELAALFGNSFDYKNNPVNDHLIEKTIKSIKNYKAQTDSIILTAKAEGENIIRKAEEEAKKIRESIENYKTKIESIITNAKLEGEVIIREAEEEAEIIIEQSKTKSQNESKKYSIEIENLLLKKQEISKEIISIEKELANLNNELENHETISSVVDFSYLISGPISEQIKSNLELNKTKQKNLLKPGCGFYIKDELTYNGSLAKGRARQVRFGKFVVAMFNANIDTVIANTKISNFSSGIKKIKAIFDKMNKSSEDHFLELNTDLLALRIEEHRLTFEHKYRLEIEKEEQRSIRQSIREEALIKKEIESFVSTREQEEKSYRAELKIAIDKSSTADREEIERLNKQISSLKEKIERAVAEKERAISMAQITRSGYVYIISNRGAFGEDVYKIGMTRRLDPLDRIKELSGASVPFNFDIHAMIPSDDAPTLEKNLHHHFAKQRMNMINLRREFFKVSFNEIRDALKVFVNKDVSITESAPAEQFESSIWLTNEGTKDVE